MVNPHILALPPYNAGLALRQFERIHGLPPLAKLDSNETPFGISPEAIVAGQTAVADAARYPDGNGTDLREALAEHAGVSKDCIVLGNGSEDLIYALYSAVLGRDDHVLTMAPGFGLHSLAAQCLQIPVSSVRYGADWQLPMNEIAAALAKQPKIFAISSPSNPVGVALTLDELDAIIAATPRKTLLLLDEAYFEFNPIASLERLQNSSLSWVSLRTFSKAYGLAGQRVGYGLCSSVVLRDGMRNLTTPFNVNSVAQAMALAALADTDFLTQTVAQTKTARAAFVEGLRALGFSPAPSQSNALFFEIDRNAQIAAKALRDKGILVKPWGEPGFEKFLRVSIGTPENNEACLEAIKKLGINPDT